LDIDAVINPRLTMVGRLLRYARGGRVQAVQKIGESTAEVIEMVVRHGAKAVGVMLKDLKLPNGALVGAIMRDKEAFIPHGRTEVREGDVVVCFVLPGLRDRVERLFARRGGLNFAGEGSPPSAAESEESRPSGEPVAVTEPEDVSDVDDASPDKA
jgi:Trk K+ transport system NAD-binding subunit